jgi:hypothetical protein
LPAAAPFSSRSSFDSLRILKLKGIAFPGNIQWDGSSLTVGDPAYKSGSAIFRVTVSGSKAAISGKTVLKDSYEVYQSWIQGDTVIGPDDGPSLDAVKLWKYPAGGKPAMTFSKGSSTFFNGPFGAVGVQASEFSGTLTVRRCTMAK